MHIERWLSFANIHTLTYGQKLKSSGMNGSDRLWLGVCLYMCAHAFRNSFSIFFHPSNSYLFLNDLIHSRRTLHFVQPSRLQNTTKNTDQSRLDQTYSTCIPYTDNPISNSLTTSKAWSLSTHLSRMWSRLYKKRCLRGCSALKSSLLTSNTIFTVI